MSDNLTKLLRIFESYGISGVWATEYSSLRDFMFDDGELSEISEKVGFPVTAEDRLFDIAARMNARPA